MIKINLLKNRVQSDQTTAATKMSISTESSEARSAIIKIILLGIATVGLMLYESQNLTELRNKSAALTMQVQALEATSLEKVAEAEALKNVENEAKELDDKVKLLRRLSKLRLREVKTMDFMQSSIPERLWLRRLTYDDNTFDLEGAAVSTPDLTEFVKKLDESAYMQDVIVIRNQEMTETNSGYRDFEFTAMVENVE